jgi:hypothetical protein
MKIYALGYTGAGDQSFILPMAPALLRITAAGQRAGTPQSINALAARFVGETPSSLTLDPLLFKPEVLTYSVDFPIAQLQQSPAATAVLDKYLPKGVLQNHSIGWMPLSTLSSSIPGITAEQIQAVQAELSAIHVE